MAFSSARELAELKNFSPAPAASASPKNPTIAFPQPPCVVLNALEVLGFKVISSTTASDVIVWTLWDGIYLGFGFFNLKKSMYAVKYVHLSDI